MSKIAVVARPGLAISWVQELRLEGHEAEAFSGPEGAADLFAHAEPEIVIIDIENPEWPESLLIPQARAAWPGCKVIAVVSSYAFRNSAVYKMGLWEPDQLLMKPLSPRLLTATVTFLWAQLRTEELKREIAAAQVALPEEARFPADNSDKSTPRRAAHN